MSPKTTPIPRWYFYFMAVVALLGLSGVALGVNGYYVDREQNEQRDATTRSVLACLDSYTKEDATSSQQVREAAARSTAATKAQLAASERWVGILQVALNYQGNDITPEATRIVEQFVEATEALQDAIEASLQAQEGVEQARRDYPLPPPPSETCEVEFAAP